MDFRKIESCIDFENFDAKHAGNLVRMVESIEHFRFSCRDQDKEHKMLADLELLRNFADGQGEAIKDPLPFARACCTWYERQRKAAYNVSWPDAS